MLRTHSVNVLLLSAIVVVELFPGVILKRVSEVLPQYDYVIVGGGTSGMVVASRLTENPNSKPMIYLRIGLELRKQRNPHRVSGRCRG